MKEIKRVFLGIVGFVVIGIPGILAIRYVVIHSAATAVPKLFPASNTPIGFSTQSVPFQPK